MDDNREKPANNRDETGRFLPGAPSGNPAGRPKKGEAWADIRDELLSASAIKLALTTPGKDGNKSTRIFDLTVGEASEKKTFRHAILVREIQNALAGEAASIQDLQDREEGKPRQSIDLGGQKGNPFRLMNDTDLDRELERLRNAQTPQAGPAAEPPAPASPP